jgi:hypothetical protein
MRQYSDKIDWPFVLTVAFFALLGMFTVVHGQGTVRPDQFTLEPNPNNTNFEVYSQKGGVNRRATLASIRAYVLQGLTSVAGPAGPAGPPNSLTIGTVTTGTAAATITGTAPSQTLNLVLPSGGGGSDTAQNLSNGGKVGYNQTINISGGTGVVFDIRDADADSLNERQVFTLDSIGAWNLTKSGGSGNIKDGVSYLDDSLKLWGYVANLRPHINRAYQVADTVARNAITSPRRGSVAIIANADGSNTQGLSFFDSLTWSIPVLVNKKTSFQYTVTAGSTTAVVWATGLGVTITTNETTGECNVAVPSGIDLKKVHITLPFGAVDGSNNYYVKLDYAGVRTYNTSISTINLPSVLVGSAVTTSMSRSSPVLFSPDGNAGVDVGISAIGGGDGSDLEIAIKDFLIATTQFVTLNFSTN